MKESILRQDRKDKKIGGGFFKNKKIFIFIMIFLLGGVVFAYLLQEGFSGIFAKNTTSVNSQKQNSHGVNVPTRDADIVGMIESINGNKITILKFDPSNMPEYKEKGAATQKTASKSGNAISLGTSSSGMPGAGAPPAGFVRSSGSSGGSGSLPGGGSSSTNRSTIMAELKKSSIGTETITVPIGIPILKKSTVGSDGQPQQEQEVFTDLTSDTVVNVWLKKTGENDSAAEFISVTGAVNMSNSNN
jgi:hypothetical protein